MSIEKPKQSLSPKEIESINTNEIASSLFETDSDQNLSEVLSSTMDKLLSEPNLYYLEYSSKGDGLSIKKRSDDSIIYFTEVPSEINVLKEVGILGK